MTNDPDHDSGDGPDIWPAEIDDMSETAPLPSPSEPFRPPPGFKPVTHGLATGVYCASHNRNLLSLAITHSVFDGLGWPLKLPYTHVPVSYWIADDACTLVLLYDPLGESLWRTASNGFSEALYANTNLPFFHPVLDRIPRRLDVSVDGGMFRVPHRAYQSSLYLDIGAILLPPAQMDADTSQEVQPRVGLDPAADNWSAPNAADWECLRQGLAPDRLSVNGWAIRGDGAVVDRTGTVVLPQGFATALASLTDRKLRSQR